MSKYAVLGNPIGHSKSPQIHKMFAQQTGQELSYTAEHLEEEEFDAFVADFFAGGGEGLNVTVPFKGKAFALANDCSPRAQLAKTVNTLFQDAEGNICGDNTDGIGLVTDLTQNNDIGLKNKRVLLIGAGGAVRGVLATFVSEPLAGLTVVNRTVSKAELLVSEFESLASIEALSFDELQAAAEAGSCFDLIINGTSSSLQGDLPQLDPKLIAEGGSCYDLMYARDDTPFVAWGKRSGAKKSIDGLGMLVEQAAESFAIWRGVRPKTAPVIAALRAES